MNYFNEGDYCKALKEFTIILEKNKKDITVINEIRKFISKILESYFEQTSDKESIINDDLLEWLKAESDNGNSYAQQLYGSIFYFGYGQPIDYDKSLHFLELSASQENIVAINMLGIMNEDGNGTPANIENAYHLYKRSSDYGYLPAMRNLAKLYQDGDYVKQDIDEAKRLFKISAEAGYPPSQYDMTDFCDDEDEKIIWLKLASDQGHLDAKYKLSEIYYERKNNDAFDLLEFAASKNHTPSMCALGKCYFTANPPVYTEAVKWLKLASDNGSVDAKTTLDLCLIKILQDEVYKNELLQRYIQYDEVQKENHLLKQLIDNKISTCSTCKQFQIHITI